MSTYLQNGSEGDLVSALQEALNNEGYDLEVDGIFGDGTEAAVRDYQSNNDLSSDGIAGPDTRTALGIQVAHPHHKSRPPDVVYLEHGSTGSNVRALQQALVNAGYDISVDGIFGDDTYNAVCDLQSNNGLNADGIVGPDTWSALEQFMG